MPKRNLNPFKLQFLTCLNSSRASIYLNPQGTVGPRPKQSHLKHSSQEHLSNAIAGRKATLLNDITIDIVKEEVDPGRGRSKASAQSPSDVEVSLKVLQSSPGSIHLPSSSDHLCEYQTSSSVKWIPCPPLIDSLASSGTQLVTTNALGQKD